MNDNDERQMISDYVAGREHAKRERESEGERERVGISGGGGERADAVKTSIRPVWSPPHCIQITWVGSVGVSFYHCYIITTSYRDCLGIYLYM